MELLKLVNLPDDEQYVCVCYFNMYLFKIFRWPVSPFEVNAYYSVLQNSIGKQI